MTPPNFKYQGYFASAVVIWNLKSMPLKKLIIIKNACILLLNGLTLVRQIIVIILSII